MKLDVKQGKGYSQKWTSVMFVASALLLSACRMGEELLPMPYQEDLVIYTAQEEGIYGPLVKEFEERTNLNVRVEEGSAQELRQYLENKTGEEGGLAWDLVFGVGTETLEQSAHFWHPYESSQASSIVPGFLCADHRWTPFSVQPLVLIYNTNVVTYRELPVGWDSLLEPRWKGRVGIADPLHSDVCFGALTAAVSASDEEDYLEQLLENINYCPAESIQKVNEGVRDGHYSVGVTTEEWAQSLTAEGADVDYIYPQEGEAAFWDGTAIAAGCSHLEAAKQFLDFTVERDTQQMLLFGLDRRPVRTDVHLPSGLVSLGQLADRKEKKEESCGQEENVLNRWKECLEHHQMGDGEA